MDGYLIWTILGIVLITIEMVTGTFYLLVLGVGAFAGALAAWLGAPFLGQVASAGVVASAGTFWVYKWHISQKQSGTASNDLDAGQPVVLAHWINQADGMMRVKYRGTEWDARIKPGDLAAAGAVPGATLFILGMDGQTLVVASQRA
ncbi:MAG TPA: NfeD family protein [Usitatibacteraceae bacterium]|nr:NfeD family protein [Usitatibacteraceae bacterium]